MFWRREWKAIAAFSILVFVVVAATILKQSGPIEMEIAKILRFGSYSDQIGDHPIVIVAAPDGRISEIKTTPSLIAGCLVGSEIHLMRKPHSLGVAPQSCR